MDDLHDRLARLGPSAPLPSASEIARSYRITVPTAQFARRMLTTRLRPAARAGSAAARYADSAWRRVAGDLEERIRSGRLHGRLPAQPDLADEYGVCVDTLRRAVRLLADEGLVTLSGPKGTFVRKPLGGVPRL
ncbi:winged helix-turn-helix domain-containing protein [Streptomyces sp. NPDC050504]|uniref:winged helix-turn-helix domain-containing protein n=1 Tax=Streptomyces sp. NPDC050504 TaxID=3365618 RepID=UPI0037A60A07